MSSFGELLKRLRRRHGLTQSELATRAGLSVEAVSLLERGRRTPRTSTARALADALELVDHDRQALLLGAAGSGPVPQQPPRYLTPLIGRDLELDRLGSLLARPGTRLVSVVGPGGVGKTRLAVAAARRAAPDALRWLAASGLSDPESWLRQAATALGVPDRGGDVTVADLVRELRHHRPLILVDGAEHRIPELTGLITALLGQTAQIRVLVTTRRRLGVPGEVVLPLRPLSLPPLEAGHDALAGSGAGALFLRVSGRSDARLGPAEAAVVARICHRVDGLPLALELAAARTDVLGVTELADALEETLSAPVPGGQPDLLDAVVGWSLGTLQPAERAAFGALSVFRGTFSQEGARAVLGPDVDPPGVVSALSALVSTSLVQREPDVAGEARFRMLRLVADHARGVLETEGDAGAVRARHADHHARLAERLAARLTGPAAPESLRALDRSADDLDAALNWACASDPVLALRLSAAVWRWCYLRGRYTTGRRWVEQALAAARGGPPRERCRALAAASTLAFLQCDYDLAHRQASACRELAVEAADRPTLAWALARLGAIARERGRYPEARAWHGEALDLGRDLGDEVLVAEQLNYLAFVSWLSGDADRALALAHEARQVNATATDHEVAVWALINLGVAHRLRGELGPADSHLARAQALSEEQLFPEGMAWTDNQRGVVARLRGDREAALAFQRVSLDQHRRLGDRWRAASVLDELALLHAEAGDTGTAGNLLVEAERERRAIGTPVPDCERDVVAAARAAVSLPGSVLAPVDGGEER